MSVKWKTKISRYFDDLFTDLGPSCPITVHMLCDQIIGSKSSRRALICVVTFLQSVIRGLDLHVCCALLTLMLPPFIYHITCFPLITHLKLGLGADYDMKANNYVSVHLNVRGCSVVYFTSFHYVS